MIDDPLKYPSSPGTKFPNIGQSVGQGDNRSGDNKYKVPPRLRVTLARVATSGTTQTTGTVLARVTSPSSRLVCSVSVSFEPDVETDISAYGAAAVTIRAVRPGRGDGRRAGLHQVLANALPVMYELAGGIREIEVSAALTLTTPNVAGAWVLEAEWEPIVVICDDELDDIYKRCTATLIRGLTAPLAP